MSESDLAQLSHDAVVVIDVGNSSTAIGVCEGMTVHGARRIATGKPGRLAQTFEPLCRRFPTGQPAVVVVACVVPDAMEWVRDSIAAVADSRIMSVGADVDLPMPVEVREPQRVGPDRVCAAAAAFERTRHACTVIDFGTAVTVDLVDDRGVFCGGAILPGPELQARSLAQGTAALPLVQLAPPEHWIGRDTDEAIRQGICRGIPGAVRALVERYAAALNSWPQVVATGGHLEMLVSGCDFIDSAVPDLTLMGVGLAYTRQVAGARQ